MPRGTPWLYTGSPGFCARLVDGARTRASTRFERLFNPVWTAPANSDYITLDFDVAYNLEDEPLYNLYDRAEFETDLEPLCVREQIGVIPYYSLAAGFLTGKYRSAADLANLSKTDSESPGGSVGAGPAGGPAVSTGQGTGYMAK